MGERRSRGRSRKTLSPAPLSSILPSLGHLNLTAKIREYKLLRAWPLVVGEAISKKASPARLMGTVLYCNVAGSAWTTEINYQKAEIIDRLNRELGYKAVTEMVLRVGPVKAPSARPAPEPRRFREPGPEDRAFMESVTAGIKDERLRELIKRVIGKSRG